MSRAVIRIASSIGLVAVSAAVVQVAPQIAHAADGSAGDPDAPTGSDSRNGLDEYTTLETCTANFGGQKVSVGFFDSIANDGSLNPARAGRRVELEYRLEDSDNGCVIFDPSVPAASSSEVNCADTSQDLGPAGSFTTPRYEAREKHFKQFWVAPKGKNRCYRVSVNSLTAYFRTR